MECIFCKIIEKQIPATLIYEDEQVVAFHDIHPKARVHVLVVPKHHVESLLHLTPQDSNWVGQLTVTLSKIAKQVGLEGGFRTVINTGPGGGQEIYHLHYHLLGGGLPKF